MKLDYLNLLCGGVVLVTLGFAAALWRTDPRMSLALAPAAVSEPRALPGSPEAAKPAVSSASGEVAHPALEPRSILPVTRRAGTPDFASMELPKRVEVFQQRHHDFMRERMATRLAEGACCRAGTHDHAAH